LKGNEYIKIITKNPGVNDSTIELIGKFRYISFEIQGNDRLFL